MSYALAQPEVGWWFVSPLCFVPLLAALRGGIKTVLIPEDNAKDLPEIPDNLKSGLEIVPVSLMDEVLKQALVSEPESIEWSEDDAAAHEAALQGTGAGGPGMTAH